jgi:uncharacterized membrane protein YesL
MPYDCPSDRPTATPDRTKDWVNSLRLAADLALLGILVTLLSLPLLTAGAAVATGSAAIHHLVTEGRWPSLADLWRTFRRRLIPGLMAGPAVLAGSALLALDVAALRRGAVPGGTAALTVVLAVAVLAAGYAALVAVRSGIAGAGACRSALALATAHPAAAVAAASVLAVAGLLAVLIHPALVPVLAGYALFALHVVARRWTAVVIRT